MECLVAFTVWFDNNNCCRTPKKPMFFVTPLFVAMLCYCVWCGFSHMGCVWNEICRKWGFEKLVYKDVKKGIRRDRKYAVQPRALFATGVHMSQNLAGKTTHKTEGRIKYYHYHGTIAERRESCKMLINSTETTYDKTPYELDTTMRDIAGVIKKFELKMIGNKLQKPRQWQLQNLLFFLYFKNLYK